MASTKKRSVGKTGRITVTLGSDQRKKVAEIAKQRRTSEATVVRWALDTYIASSQPNGSASDRRTG